MNQLTLVFPDTDETTECPSEFLFDTLRLNIPERGDCPYQVTDEPTAAI